MQIISSKSSRKKDDTFSKCTRQNPFFCKCVETVRRYADSTKHTDTTYIIHSVGADIKHIFTHACIVNCGAMANALVSLCVIRALSLHCKERVSVLGGLCF